MKGWMPSPSCYIFAIFVIITILYLALKLYLPSYYSIACTFFTAAWSWLIQRPSFFDLFFLRYHHMFQKVWALSYHIPHSNLLYLVFLFSANGNSGGPNQSLQSSKTIRSSTLPQLTIFYHTEKVVLASKLGSLSSLLPSVYPSYHYSKWVYLKLRSFHPSV